MGLFFACFLCCTLNRKFLWSVAHLFTQLACSWVSVFGKKWHLGISVEINDTGSNDTAIEEYGHGEWQKHKTTVQGIFYDSSASEAVWFQTFFQPHFLQYLRIFNPSVWCSPKKKVWWKQATEQANIWIHYKACYYFP